MTQLVDGQVLDAGALEEGLERSTQVAGLDRRPGQAGEDQLARRELLGAMLLQPFDQQRRRAAATACRRLTSA